MSRYDDRPPLPPLNPRMYGHVLCPDCNKPMRPIGEDWACPKCEPEAFKLTGHIGVA